MRRVGRSPRAVFTPRDTGGEGRRTRWRSREKRRWSRRRKTLLSEIVGRRAEEVREWPREREE